MEKAKTQPLDEPIHRFITNDYLFLLFRNKPFLHLRVLWAVTIITCLSGEVAFGLQGLVGLKFGMTGGYLSNTIAAFLETIIPPLFFLLYLLIPGSIVDLFKTLNANGVIGACRRGRPDMTTYSDFQKRLETWVNRGWWTWGILLVIVGYWFAQYRGLEPQEGYPLWLSISQNVVFSLVLYTASFCLVRIIITLIFTNGLFYRFNINISPLHPDGSGGLGVLSRILWLSAGVMFLVGLGLSLAVLPGESGILSGLDITLIVMVYLTLIPSLLIGWLWLPHRTLVKTRDTALLRWAKEFEKVMHSGKPEDDLKIFEKSSAKLKRLREHYEWLRENFPTWPLQLGALRRLILTFILPPLIQLLLPYAVQACNYLYAHFLK